MKIQWNVEQKLGTMKPLHGVCNGPLFCGGLSDLSKEYLEMGVPFVRLHDTEYPNPQVVDVFQIFRNWDADPLLPESYDFLLTDQYMEKIHGIGAGVIYRLGTTIEHTPQRRFTHPPKDPQKFAVVCEHIIRHYREGWADGYCWNEFSYWEIWNEPEDCDGTRQCMWSGTKEQYFELYEVVSKHLKQTFGDSIQVGGFASCGFYGLESDSKDVQSFLQYFHDFLTFIQKKNCPLDFFSYHWYGKDATLPAKHSLYARKQLNEAGYRNAAIVLDEWNWDWKSVEDWKRMREMPGAMHVAKVFCTLSDGAVDIANYYDANPMSPWSGIFPKESGVFNGEVNLKNKPYYPFVYYNKLYRMKQRIAVETDADLWVLAATDGTKTGILLVNEGEDKMVLLGGLPEEKIVSLQITDRENDCAVRKMPAGAVKIPECSVGYIEIE